MKILSIVDAAYIAGIMDGEGTIALSRHRKSIHHNFGYGTFCVVTNTNRNLLQWLKDTTHLGRIAPKPRCPKWKLCFQWILRVEEITPFLTAILPYMRVRKEHAETLLEFIATTRYTGPYNPLTEKEIIHKMVLFDILEELNKRGA